VLEVAAPSQLIQSPLEIHLTTVKNPSSSSENSSNFSSTPRFQSFLTVAKIARTGWFHSFFVASLR
jgi:hypothetical protein